MWHLPVLVLVESKGKTVKWPFGTPKGRSGVPQNGWSIRENPIRIDDLGGPPLFLETPVCTMDFCSSHLRKQSHPHGSWKTSLSFEACHFLNIVGHVQIQDGRTPPQKKHEFPRIKMKIMVFFLPFLRSFFEAP